MESSLDWNKSWDYESVSPASLEETISNGKRLLEESFSGTHAGNLEFLNLKKGRIRNMLTNWVNSLGIFERIDDVVEDFRDASKLCDLVEAMSGKKIVGVTTKAKVPTGTVRTSTQESYRSKLFQGFGSA